MYVTTTSSCSRRLHLSKFSGSIGPSRVMHAQFQLIIKYVAGLRRSAQAHRIARIKYAISNLFKRRVINSCSFPWWDSGKIVKIHAIGNYLTSSPEPVTKLSTKAFRGDRNSDLFKERDMPISKGGDNEEKITFKMQFSRITWPSLGKAHLFFVKIKANALW